jgi:hypothetical protein
VLELALRETPGVELLSWDQGQESWLRVPIPGVRAQFLRVAPDAQFSLREAGQVRHFFLEVDRSTEEHRRLLQKYLGYWWYLQSPHFHQAHPDGRRVNVLFVTTGNRRMLNMMETLRRMPKPNRANHGGKGVFRFACAVECRIDSPRFILARIWQSIAAPSLSLLE